MMYTDQTADLGLYGLQYRLPKFAAPDLGLHCLQMSLKRTLELRVALV